MNKIQKILKATPATLQKLILLFWSCYFSVVTLTNVLDGLRSLGILSKDWKFASGNFASIQKTTTIYGVSDGLNAFLFCGAILLEVIALILFWKAFKNSSERNIYSAHISGLILFAGFIMADEIFFEFTLEAIHMRVFFGLLVSIITLMTLKRAIIKEN